MNCRSCHRVLYPSQTKCPCGAQVFRQPSPGSGYVPALSAAVNQRFGDKMSEVNAYVARYRANNPGTTKCEACTAYLREHKLMGALKAALPVSMLSDEIRRASEEEAAAERAAIQAEGI